MKIVYHHKCSNCNKYSFTYDSLYHSCDNVYYWCCNNCCEQSNISFTNEGKSIHQELTGKRTEQTKTLVKIKDSSIYLFVDGIATDGETDHHQFYYEDNTSVVNILSSCTSVTFNGVNADSVDFFEFVDSIVVTGNGATSESEAEQILKQKAMEEE